MSRVVRHRPAAFEVGGKRYIATGAKWLPFSQEEMVAAEREFQRYDRGRTKVHLVQSRTDAKRFYKVVISRVGPVCHCAGFKYRQKCWHVDHVKRLLEEDDTKSEG